MKRLVGSGSVLSDGPEGDTEQRLGKAGATNDNRARCSIRGPAHK